MGFSRLAEVLQCTHIVSTSTAALAHLLPSRTFTCRSRLKSLTTQGCACERKTRLFRPSPDMKELHGKSHVDRSNSVLDDLIFEEVVKKGEAGHIKRKVLPCLDPKRRLTRPFTTFCNNTHRHHRDPTCFLVYRILSMHSVKHQRPPGLTWEDISGQAKLENHWKTCW